MARAASVRDAGLVRSTGPVVSLSKDASRGVPGLAAGRPSEILHFTTVFRGASGHAEEGGPTPGSISPAFDHGGRTDSTTTRDHGAFYVRTAKTAPANLGQTTKTSLSIDRPKWCLRQDSNLHLST